MLPLSWKSDIAMASTTDSGSIIELAGISRTMFIYMYQSYSDSDFSIDTDTYTMYVTATTLNIREEPNTDCEVIGQLSFNDEVEVWDFNDEWVCYEDDNGQVGYVSKQYLSDVQTDYEEYDTPYISFKSWMPYTSITSTGSSQYKLQQMAYTGTYGIRMVNSRYCVALGSYFGVEIGQYFDLVLENGTVIPCIMADMKADEHTDESNIVTVANGCMAEFVVDYSALNKYAKRDGDISSCCDEWDSAITQVIVYDKKVM